MMTIMFPMLAHAMASSVLSIIIEVSLPFNWGTLPLENSRNYPLEEPQNLRPALRMYGFGYDVHTNNYKVVLVVSHLLRDSSGNFVEKRKVMVHTLGTDAWKRIQKFPFNCVLHKIGTFVSGTINWLVYKESRRWIASFDLGNESNQEVSSFAS